MKLLTYLLSITFLTSFLLVPARQPSTKAPLEKPALASFLGSWILGDDDKEDAKDVPEQGDEEDKKDKDDVDDKDDKNDKETTSPFVPTTPEVTTPAPTTTAPTKPAPTKPAVTTSAAGARVSGKTVREEALKLYPHAEILSIERDTEDRTYDIELRKGNDKIELEFSETDGSLVSTKIQKNAFGPGSAFYKAFSGIDIGRAKSLAIQAVRKNYPGGDILQVKPEVENGRAVIEVKLLRNRVIESYEYDIRNKTLERD